MSRSPRKLVAALTVGVLVVTAAAWFLVVSPKRSEASRLADDVTSTHAQLVKRKAELAAGPQDENLAPLSVLERALPDDAKTSRVIRELSKLSSSNGVFFAGVTPQAAVAGAGFQVRPVEAVFEGQFENLSSFLTGVRRLVGVENELVRASGRLYTIDSISMLESDEKFPKLKATLKLNVFQFGSAPAAAAPATATEPSS